MGRYPILIEMLSRRAGRDVTTPSGAEFLRNDIESATGELIALNTLKRICGILDYGGSHRKETMDIIARYLGYSSWDVAKDVIENRISGFNDNGKMLNMEDLPAMQLVELQWEPDRRIVLRHKKGKLYTVMESENSKLKAGDELTLSLVAAGYPFYVGEVVRNGKSLGSYTAASVAGVKRISLL